MFPERAYPQTFTVGNIFLGFDSAAAPESARGAHV
jgi:hypothetical protein